MGSCVGNKEWENKGKIGRGFFREDMHGGCSLVVAKFGPSINGLLPEKSCLLVRRHGCPAIACNKLTIYILCRYLTGQQEASAEFWGCAILGRESKLTSSLHGMSI